ncbi:hypothetical protein UlMin_008191 [Ulmus minor]
MAKPNFPEKQTTWGTLEELLLAFAVHRYGSDSWDSIAAELRKRSSTPQLLTPQTCKEKFHDLKRRFSRNGVVSTTDDSSKTSIPLLDELRQLRVAELRREVERNDRSIESLRSKVEKLEEEEKADLDKNVEGENKEEENKPNDLSPENVAGKGNPGEGSVHDDRSFNESNTTDPKDENPKTGVPATENEPERIEPAAEKAEPVGEGGKAAVEDSYDGSSDSRAKGSAAVSPVQESERAKPERGRGDSAELSGSVAESKGGQEGAKENSSNSEVQSSASLSRKKGPGPDEPDEPDQSAASKRVSVESKPLADFLEILRSHKSASFFERRLEIQEKPDYRKIIRQHMDLETVRNRLEEGWYSGCSSKFFRDLLLICNNFITFFGKKSLEHKAAFELRLLISKEMTRWATKQESSRKEQSPPSQSQKAKPESEPSDMLPRKPINACRKRSSIAARASTSSSGPERKKEQAPALLDAKPAVTWKPSNDDSSDEDDELPITKKRRKDRSRASSRSNSNKNGRSRTNTNANKNSDTNTASSTRGNSNDNSASKSEREKSSSNNASTKKKSATNFLNRMKRGSSSNNGSLQETLKSPDSSRGGAEQKKIESSKGSKQKEQSQSSRKGSATKPAKEPESPAKRSVGRPSKRAVATSPIAPVKRSSSRQAAETEATNSRSSKKRSRK